MPWRFRSRTRSRNRNAATRRVTPGGTPRSGSPWRTVTRRRWRDGGGFTDVRCDARCYRAGVRRAVVVAVVLTLAASDRLAHAQDPNAEQYQAHVDRARASLAAEAVDDAIAELNAATATLR